VLSNTASNRTDKGETPSLLDWDVDHGSKLNRLVFSGSESDIEGILKLFFDKTGRLFFWQNRQSLGGQLLFTLWFDPVGAMALSHRNAGICKLSYHF
jgi:hypothetical protein